MIPSGCSVEGPVLWEVALRMRGPRVLTSLFPLTWLRASPCSMFAPAHTLKWTNSHRLLRHFPASLLGLLCSQASGLFSFFFSLILKAAIEVICVCYFLMCHSKMQGQRRRHTRPSVLAGDSPSAWGFVAVPRLARRSKLLGSIQWGRPGIFPLLQM